MYLSETTTKSYLQIQQGILGHFPFIHKRLLPEFKENKLFFASFQRFRTKNPFRCSLLKIMWHLLPCASFKSPISCILPHNKRAKNCRFVSQFLNKETQENEILFFITISLGAKSAPHFTPFNNRALRLQGYEGLRQPVAKMLRHSHEKTTFLASNRSWSQVFEI